MKMDDRRLFDILMGLLTVIGLGLSGWALSSVVSLGQDVVRLEASHDTFVTKDVYAQSILDTWKEIASIRQSIQEIPKDQAPAWFIQRVDKLEAKVDKLIADGK